MILNLTINNINNYQEIIITCDNYNWNGNNYSNSGTYIYTLQSLNGCDSIITLNLNIYQTIYNTVNITTCGSLTWNGNNYSQKRRSILIFK